MNLKVLGIIAVVLLSGVDALAGFEKWHTEKMTLNLVDVSVSAIAKELSTVTNTPIYVAAGADKAVTVKVREKTPAQVARFIERSNNLVFVVSAQSITIKVKQKDDLHLLIPDGGQDMTSFVSEDLEFGAVLMLISDFLGKDIVFATIPHNLKNTFTMKGDNVDPYEVINMIAKAAELNIDDSGEVITLYK